METIQRTGTYIKIVPDNNTKQRLQQFADLLCIQNPVPTHEIHVTVLTSAEQCGDGVCDEIQFPITANGYKFETFENNFGSYLVLLLDSPQIRQIHDTIITKHCVMHMYPEFLPHITLSYDFDMGTAPSVELASELRNLVFTDVVMEGIKR